MRISTAAAAFGILSFSTMIHAARLVDETDRFTGIRTVAWSTVPSSPGTFALNSYAYVAESGESSYQLELLTWSSSGQYRDCNFVNWLVDGRRATELNTEYNHSYAGSASAERFTLRVSRKTLEKLASAKKIEYQVCSDEGVATGEELEGIRQVSATTK